MRHRTCKICGKDYKTEQKFSQICDLCKEKRLQERKKTKLGGKTKPYWDRFLDGDEI